MWLTFSSNFAGYVARMGMEYDGMVVRTHMCVLMYAHNHEFVTQTGL